MRKILWIVACCAISAPAVHAEQPDAYSGAAPPHFYFDHYAPPAPSAEGRFGFDSGEDRGLAGQFLREDHYEESHGLKSSSTDCEFSSCPCPNPFWRNSTNCAPVVIPPRPAPPDDPCMHGICEQGLGTNQEETNE
jgi:hypothetical protein